MRLRKSVATPDRFDEAVFGTKRKDPTVPLYPDLLAAQVVPFNSQNRNAVFPSLPLRLSEESGEIEERIETSRPSTTGVNATSHVTTGCLEQDDNDCVPDRPKIEEQEISQEHNEVLNSAESTKPRKEICTECCKEVRIEWSSLALSVQHHIFNTLLKHQRYAEVVAVTLKLTYQELEQIQNQLNIRKIYQVPLEDVWTFGAMAGDIGPGAIHPDTLNELMEYLVFASHYEVAGENEVKRGREFLIQLCLDDKIMDIFGTSAAKEHPHVTTALETPQPKLRATLKRRRNSTGRILTIDSDQANASHGNDLVHATAPANITSFSHTLNNIRGQKNTTGLSAIGPYAVANKPALAHQYEVQPGSKRLRLSIDGRGHASITRDTRLSQDSGVSGATSKATSVNVKDLFTFSTAVHKCHNPSAFAFHLQHAAFPLSVRNRLLRQDPRKMNHLDHWFVYGTPWLFMDYVLQYGVAPKPADPEFNPRKTLLDGNHLKDHALRALVDLQNEWVRANRWQKKKGIELMTRFNRAADLRLKGLKQDHSKPARLSYDAKIKTSLPIGTQTSQVKSLQPQCKRIEQAHNQGFPDPFSVRDGAHNMVRSTTPFPLLPHDHLDPIQVNSTNDRGYYPKTAFPLLVPQHTPDNRTIPQHTGDTTIDILGGTVYSIRQTNQSAEPGYIQRSHFDGEDVQPIVEKAELENTETSVDNPTAASTKTKAVESCFNHDGFVVTKAPNYSPISDQDQESLPAWARYHALLRHKSTASSPTPQRTATQLPFGRTSGATIRANQFLRDIIDAAAEDVMNYPDNSSIQSTPSKPPTQSELFRGLGIVNQYQIKPSNPIQQPLSFQTSSEPVPTSTLVDNHVMVPHTYPDLDPELFQQSTLMSRGGFQVPQESTDIQNKAMVARRDNIARDGKLHLPIVSTVTASMPVRQRNVTSSSHNSQIHVPSVLDPSEKLNKAAREVSGSRNSTPLSLPSEKVGSGSSSKSATIPKPTPRPVLKTKAQPKQNKASNVMSTGLVISTKPSGTGPPSQTHEASLANSKTGTRTTQSTNMRPTKKAPFSAKSTTTTPVSSAPTPTPPGTKKRRKDLGVKRGTYKKRKPAGHDTALATPSTTSPSGITNGAVRKKTAKTNQK